MTSSKSDSLAKAIDSVTKGTVAKTSRKEADIKISSHAKVKGTIRSSVATETPGSTTKAMATKVASTNRTREASASSRTAINARAATTTTRKVATTSREAKFAKTVVTATKVAVVKEAIKATSRKDTSSHPTTARTNSLMANALKRVIVGSSKTVVSRITRTRASGPTTTMIVEMNVVAIMGRSRPTRKAPTPVTTTRTSLINLLKRRLILLTKNSTMNSPRPPLKRVSSNLSTRNSPQSVSRLAFRHNSTLKRVRRLKSFQ